LSSSWPINSARTTRTGTAADGQRGLRRIYDKGAVFTENAYPYAATLTCAGHATIGTGTFPATHGMSGNDFYDRALRRLVPCAFDADAVSVPFGGEPGTEHHSPRSLLVPTFADELRRQAKVPPRIVSLGQKPRTAITLAGRPGPETVVAWEEDAGVWATSTTYSKTPWADVDEFVRARPMKNDYGKVWTPLMPPSAYRFVDDGAGEATPGPWTRVFPHPLVSRTGKPDNEFVTAWEESPWNDAFLTDLAIHLLRSRRLGTGAGTDYLAISFPSLDHAGHEFGPRSHEVQDNLYRIDINLGRLLDAIEAQVGTAYVLGLSSDHGVAIVPEQVVAEAGDGGRISTTALRAAINGAITQTMGQAMGTVTQFVASIYEEQVALTPGVYDRLRAKPGALSAVRDAIASVRGVAAVFTADEIVAGSVADSALGPWQLSYVPGRSGDFAITPKANWIIRSTSGTTHGSLNSYDQRVPLVLFGQGIRPGRYAGRTTPADMVVTFATLTGIQMPRAQGRALTEALVR
jgi:predicted AlkP superfamily pyrophosphatase or phosphodiesterase